jgi:hypothetical protein
VGGNGIRKRVFQGIEQTKVRHTHRGHAMGHPLNVNSDVNYENRDCKIGTVCAGGPGTSGRGKGERRGLRCWYMVDGLHIPT